jgi:protease II
MGDTNPARDLGFVKWHDPYAALEDQTSVAFTQALERENAIFQDAIIAEKSKITKLVNEFTQLLDDAAPRSPGEAQEMFLWHGYLVYIQHTYGNRINVWIQLGVEIVRTFEDLEAFGIDPDSDHYFTIKDIGDGDQTFQLAVYEMGVHSPQYNITPVGPHAAFHGDYLYYESIENQLRSDGILRVNKLNGRNKARIFSMPDKRFQVELVAPPRQSDLFIKISNALSQRIALIHGADYSWLMPAPEKDGNGISIFPVSKKVYGKNNSINVSGMDYPLPKKSFLQEIQHIDTTTVCAVTVKDGICNLYIFDLTTHKFTTLFEGKEPNNIMLHAYSTVPSYTLTSYHESSKVYEIQEYKSVFVKKLHEPVKMVKHTFGYARAKDGAKIPYTFVSAVKNPKKLIVIGYGAYGISSSRSYPKRWLPWLTHGFALVEAAPRGGRENGDAWHDAARTALRKKTTFDDVAAVIESVQKRFRFSREQTVFYGRSAGGMLAAYIGLKYSNLVGAVYAEVPYLDVLRTTTNIALPLTILEYDEFGNPAERPEEYEALLKLSPVDIIESAPKNPPLFLLRSAIHDTQVYPYESLKFAAKLRSLGWPVYVGMDEDGGHFVKTKNMYSQYAIDFLLIDAQLQSRSFLKTRKNKKAYARTSPRLQSSRGTWRRRTSSRKH